MNLVPETNDGKDAEITRLRAEISKIKSAYASGSASGSARGSKTPAITGSSARRDNEQRKTDIESVRNLPLM